jgi:hypothetical protein
MGTKESAMICNRGGTSLAKNRLRDLLVTSGAKRLEPLAELVSHRLNQFDFGLHEKRWRNMADILHGELGVTHCVFDEAVEKCVAAKSQVMHEVG